MPTSQVIVPWKEGLHLREAAKLIRVAQQFRASVSLRHDGKEANTQSVLSIQMLAASEGALVEMEANGEDAHDALRALESAFAIDHDGS